VVLASWTVSRRHARLRRDGDRWILEDLRSTNGTAVNGRPVTAPVALHDGDFVTFGIVGMRFSAADERHLVR
jgi:pSer/pThr/pTyr-binding forkhead associated (FHA) protein